MPTCGFAWEPQPKSAMIFESYLTVCPTGVGEEEVGYDFRKDSKTFRFREMDKKS